MTSCDVMTSQLQPWQRGRVVVICEIHYGVLLKWQLNISVCWIIRLSPLEVNKYCAHSFAINWQLPFLNQWKGENDHRKHFMINLHGKILLLTRQGWNPQPPDDQLDAHPTEQQRPAKEDNILVTRPKQKKLVSVGQECPHFELAISASENNS